MRVAIVTFDGFNEIDSLVSATILNRLKSRGLVAEIVCPQGTVVSANGIRLTAQKPLEAANDADAVLFGSGTRTAELVADRALMGRLALDPRRQLIGCQCSGALPLAALGLLGDMPACTDFVTRPLLEAAGVRVLERSFHAEGNIASTGGCLASPMLATWVAWRLLGRAAAESALVTVAPVGELRTWVAGILGAVAPFVEEGVGQSQSA